MPDAPAIDSATHNAEVAAKVAAQDMAGQSTAKIDPLQHKQTEDTLDALMKKAEERSGTPPKADDQQPPVPPADDAAKKAAEAEAAKKAATDAEATKKAEAERAEGLKKADDIFKDQPGLPPNASPKSAEAFASIKLKATQEISALQADLEKAKNELAEFQKKSSIQTPEQQAQSKELKDLREWRAKLDVDFDPKFKEFDKGIDEAREFIYAQLRKSPVINEATIKKIQELGGPDMVIWTEIFKSVNDSTMQRLIESKLADIEMAKYKKDHAIKDTKANLGQYLNERQSQLSKEATVHTDSTRTELGSLFGALEWTKPQTAASNATKEEKEAAETHNKFVEQTKAQLEEAINDNSPKMRAIMLTGMAQLFNLQRVHDALKAKYDALEKEATSLREYKDSVKKAARSRTPESQAPTGGAAQVTPKANQFTTPATDALDSLARQVTEERRAKGLAA
jgi:hypothetical protein